MPKKRDPDWEHVQIRMTTELKNKVHREANKLGLSIGDYIRVSVIRTLENISSTGGLAGHVLDRRREGVA